jgi:hypothetical protein
VSSDIDSINQSMFLPEAAAALIQATTKVSIVQWVLKVRTHITKSPSSSEPLR